MNHRSLWRPRLEEAKQCASCPFRDDNDKEFGAIVRAIKKASGMPPEHGASVSEARVAVRLDVIGPGGRGDFVCHATAYGPGMKLRAKSDHRQCPGASKAWKKVP